MKPSQRLRFAQLALQVARPHWPPYGSKYSPKKLTQPSLWACLWVKEYLRQDYRGLEDLLARSAERRAAWGLGSVPDPSTFHGFMRHRVTPRCGRRPGRRPCGGSGGVPDGGRRAFPDARPATTT
jgi:ribosomal protein L32